MNTCITEVMAYVLFLSNFSMLEHIADFFGLHRMKSMKSHSV